jgi:hypothetical protein
MRTDTATVIYCDPRTLEGDRPAPPLVAPFDVTDCISLAWDRVAAAVASMPPRTRKSPKRRAIIARAVRSLETEVSAAGLPLEAVPRVQIEIGRLALKIGRA